MSENPGRTPPADLPHIPGYEIREILGKGGQGTVYRARQKSLNRVVAIKVLSPKNADSTSLKRRFLAEARLQSKLHHPNILQGIDVNEHQGLWYFAMEFVSGTDAQVLLTQGGALPEREVLKIARQVADALAYAHGHGIVHGDIKPENIVLPADGSVKMIDFGIARLAREESDKDCVEGTREFMAPEVKSGKTKGDIRSDMYSLGVTLYELLTASLPPIAKGSDKEGPDPKEREPKIGLATAALVKMLLAVDPAHRPASPQALIKALDKAAAGAPVQKVVAATASAAAPRRWRAVALPIVFAVAVLGGAIGLYLASQEDDVPDPKKPDGAAEAIVLPKPSDSDPVKLDPPKPDPPKPDPPKSGPPSLAFSPKSVQVLEGETFTIRVTATNLPVALKPLIKVLDADGRDISASVAMPTIEREPTDHTTVHLKWTAPFWP
ncbi:MAG: serine/threonine protein kinase, partial [Planctomycetes bacterium]|nr:serine/threonine protein kinase [Planctomycetota bacterium]